MRLRTLAAVLPLLAVPAIAQPAPPDAPTEKTSDKDAGDQDKKTIFDPKFVTDKHFKAEEVKTEGSVTIGGNAIPYQAVAGTLVIHPREWDDVPKPDDKGGDKDKGQGGPKNVDAEAAMSFVAYFKKGDDAGKRPITFIFNGGPGSATVWLHMGAFGPMRVVTADDTHTPAAPYQLVNNDQSILDATDMVFIDAPGTGFGRLAGDDKEKGFWGVDQDGYAFSEFITQFLTKYSRWNSPKYLFGESYGTTRSAVLANLLQDEREIDFNGIILLSQILNFDLSVDGPERNPGVDLAYQLALPTYAATAWYHNKLPDYQNGPVRPLLDEVEKFAMGDYAQALGQGGALPDDQKQAIAEKLHRYTGLPVAYILKADLRIAGGEFEKNLQDDQGLTTGRLDSRFSGTTIDPLSKDSDYDPQSSSISSAYISAYNDYARNVLKFGADKRFLPSARAWGKWDWSHQQPGDRYPSRGVVNVMPDLAVAMKVNPNLRVQLHAGYFDLATPYFEGVYEMKHLPMPAALQKNISYVFYESGHMVYAHQDSMKLLHDSVATFIDSTDNMGAAQPGQPGTPPAPPPPTPATPPTPNTPPVPPTPATPPIPPPPPPTPPQ